MALHDDVDREARFDDPNERTDSFRWELISVWLVAALLAIAMLLLQPPSVASPGHAICLSLAQAAPPGSADQPSKPAELYECSDLDYAYERC